LLPNFVPDFSPDPLPALFSNLLPELGFGRFGLPAGGLEPVPLPPDRVVVVTCLEE